MDYVAQGLLALVVVLLIFAGVWYSFRHERAFEQTVRQRESLSDDEFYDRFYAASDIPRDIPLKVRAIVGEVYGLSSERLRPDDNFAV